MSDYLTDVQLLDDELVGVERAFRGLAGSDWHRPTLLQPPGGMLPPWTIFELAGHLDIAIGVTRMLIASQQDGQVGRDRVSFFIFPPRAGRPGLLRPRLHHGGGQVAGADG